jgi:hypothetical protein
MTPKIHLAAIAITLLFSSGALSAAEDPDHCAEPNSANVVKCFAADTAIPDSPGLMIVGLGTDDVLRPTTPKQLGMALTNGFDDQGKPVSGFAVDFAPYKLLAPATTQKKYKDSAWLRPLWNTQFSAGVGKGTDDDDEALKVGYGLSTVLWRSEKSDAVRNTEHQDCLKKALAPPAIAAAVAASSTTSADKRIANCFSTFDTQYSSGTAFTVGYAGSQISEGGDWSGLESGASGSWASFAFAFDELRPKEKGPSKFRPELLLHWRDLHDELVADSQNAGSFIEQNSSQYGLLLRLHGKRMNFHAEKCWARTKRAARPIDDTERFAVGVEWKLSENTWLVMTFGGEDGRDDNGDETRIRTGIKFGRVEQSTFAAN